MPNRLTNLIAAFLLTFVFFISVFSVKDDSATMDEMAHLPAGYSYLTQKDMRLNPEHPPLIKDLAAIPLLFIKGINFPQDIKAWKEDINGQWEFGFNFLYNSGNPADKMIFWSRIPMILILILLGFYIFKWAKELFGNKAALLSLFLFSFSPTFLAHGRLVTTDVGAATGIFIATYYFIKALKSSTKRNIILAGISFGLAELCKFSVILLIPFFAILALIWWLIKLGTWQKTLKILILVFIIGYLLIWPVYQYHVWNYPPERQARDTEFLLGSTPFPKVREILVWASTKPILRAYAHYGLGLALVLQRAAGGHTTYFLGEVSAAGWKNYFPVVYSVKEPLAFHILTLIALLYASFLIKKAFWQNTFQRMRGWLKNHFPEFAMLGFIGLYWVTSLTSNLNIGVRHLLPAFPFTILLVSGAIVNFLREPFLKLKYALLGVLILWQILSVISIYPHFLAYFNELAQGPDNGYIYTVNSNLDWGQDLKRLKKWIDEKNIDKIYVDYFGGGDAQYYLKEKYAPWWGTRDSKEFPKGSYLAVSATFLQGGRGLPTPGFNQPYGYYHWLDKYTPVAKIGYSIFIYYIVQ
jgi:4-amino-4-deoxy-L-arabinose transferase-like glycosyltransferase